MDYLAMSADEIDEVLVSRQEEMGASGIERGEILKAVNAGTHVIERSQFGIAIVQPSQPELQMPIPFLWLLYVLPEHRGQGHGRKFVRQILKKHAAEYFMGVHVYDSRHSKFFSQFGFRVVSRDNETGLRVMAQR